MKRHNILALIVAGGITTFGVGVLAMCLAPVFTSCIIALVSTVFLFLMSEQWYTHDAAGTKFTFFLSLNPLRVTDCLTHIYSIMNK